MHRKNDRRVYGYMVGIGLWLSALFVWVNLAAAEGAYHARAKSLISIAGWGMVIQRGDGSKFIAYTGEEE